MCAQDRCRLLKRLYLLRCKKKVFERIEVNLEVCATEAAVLAVPRVDIDVGVLGALIARV